MKRIFTVLMVILLITSCSTKHVECCLPQTFKNMISEVIESKENTEKSFYEINDYLFEKEADALWGETDSFANMKSCEFYKNSVKKLFISNDIHKRVISYRLIGHAKDSNYNEELIARLEKEPETILKQWNIVALINNKAPNTTDLIFKQFIESEDLPIQILSGMYVQYDTLGVKETCWKNIENEDRNAQIMAVQFLASYGRDEDLTRKLRSFIQTWEEEYKGWVLTALTMQKEGNIKELVLPFANTENVRLKTQIIKTLENSPTEEDRAYAKIIKNN